MFIGLDIGGTNIKGILTNHDGKVLEKSRIETGKNKNEILKNCLSLIDTLCGGKQSNMAKVMAIGVGVAGIVNSRKGVIIKSPNVPVGKNYPLAEELRKKTGKPTFIENDANVALIGEWWKGNGSKYENWIMLTLGTGIGGGAIVNNQVLFGRDGFAAEFGHMIIEYNGQKCECGSKGCFERYGSATALMNLVEKMLQESRPSSVHERLKLESLSARLVYEEALKGDSLAREAMEKTGYFLGIGISSLISIFNPEAVIIAGGLSKAHKILLPIIKDVVARTVMPGLKDRVKYHVVKNEDTGPALGAVKNAIDNLGKK